MFHHIHLPDPYFPLLGLGRKIPTLYLFNIYLLSVWSVPLKKITHMTITSWSLSLGLNTLPSSPTFHFSSEHLNDLHATKSKGHFPLTILLIFSVSPSGWQLHRVTTISEVSVGNTLREHQPDFSFCQSGTLLFIVQCYASGCSSPSPSTF